MPFPCVLFLALAFSQTAQNISPPDALALLTEVSHRHADAAVQFDCIVECKPQMSGVPPKSVARLQDASHARGRHHLDDVYTYVYY